MIRKLGISVLLFLAITACGLFSQALPSVTHTPEPTPIPGWIKFEGNGVELWLPDTYLGGDLSKDLEVIKEKLKNLGPEYEPSLKAIEQINPSASLLWAIDSEVSSFGFLSNVNVFKEQVLSTISVDTYIDAIEKQLPSRFKLIERSNIQLDRYSAGSMLFDSTAPGRQTKEIFYIIKEGNTIYGIVYATYGDEFEQQQVIIEKSINTFRVLP
jgi:hypothetical protein